MSVKITSIQSGSVAEKYGLKAGDELVLIDGNEINDMLDLQFFQTNRRLKALVRAQGEEKTIEIKKSDEYEPLGLDFETYLIDKHHFCKNKCMFCFIDQLPKGMRESLYFKDDDERLSFLFGNYVTLTNLSRKEIDRIKKLKISPINISVHTTDPDLRVKMMKNPSAAQINQLMQEFADAQIHMNAQIVLCRGINDGNYLRDTIARLQQLYPWVQSASIVPIGLTKHRQGLAQMETFDGQAANFVIEQVERCTEDFYNKHRKRIVYLSDEFYLKAGREIPPKEYYEDFPQIENGVGMVRTFIDNFNEELQLVAPLKEEIAVDIATGEGFYPVLKQMSDKANEQLGSSLKIKIHSVKNNFFGGNVNVTGLLTAQDIIAQLQGKLISKRLLLCSDVLRREGDLFLDDQTPRQVEKALSTNIEFYSNDGYDLLSGILQQEV